MCTTNGNYTGGNDAVLALNIDQLNELLINSYAQNIDQFNSSLGATAFCVAGEGSSYNLVSINFGSPSIQFVASSSLVELTFPVSGGVYMYSGVPAVKAGENAPYAVLFDGAVSYVQLSVPLNSVSGESSAGSATLSFQNIQAVSVNLEGLPQGNASTQIGTALQTYLQSTGITLTSASFPISTPAVLTPSAIGFAISSDETTLYVLMATGQNDQIGAAPVQNPLDALGSSSPTYSAAIAISNATLFQNLLPTDGVTIGGVNFDATFNQSSGVSLTESGGSSTGINCSVAIGPNSITITGPYPNPNDPSANCFYFSPSTFTLSPGNNGMSVSASGNWVQQYTYTNSIGEGGKNIVSATCTGDLMPSISSSNNNEILFGQPNTSTLTGTVVNEAINYANDGLDEFIYSNLPSDLLTEMGANIGAAMSWVTFPAITTFTLDNFLFPAGPQVSLSAATLPGDLVGLGSIAPQIEISGTESNQGQSGSTQNSPIELTAGSGAYQLSATGGSGSYSWSVISGPGTIDTDGAYTPPPSQKRPAVALICATDQSNSDLAGFISICVVPATSGGLLISPGTVICGPRAQVLVGAVASASPMPANPTPLPVSDLTFTPSKDFDAGMATVTFTAPSTTGNITVNVSETVDDKQLSGSSIWTVAEVQNPTITVQTGSNPVSAGGTLQLAASGIPEGSSLYWALFPDTPGAATGSISWTGNGLTAIYTAPSVQNGTVNAVAFYANTNGLGVGFIGINPATSS